MKYVAPEDIVVYSIDEVFMDITDYLPASGMSAREFARKIILDVMDTTGITATAGIGTNLFSLQGCNGYRSKASPGR